MRICYALLLTPTLLLLYPATGMTYSRYNGTPGCDDCHPGFVNRGPLHQAVHVGNQNMTNTCDLCHTSTGDNPQTNSSGGGVGCSGCHDGPGLRAHHANAGAPADQWGLRCSDCHGSDPQPVAESTVPQYYLRGDVNVKDPCSGSGAGSEDYDGDNKGLDNDGELVYDGNDPDCVVPVEPSTWGRIKALFFE
jgi:hypothetical protein